MILQLLMAAAFATAHEQQVIKSDCKYAKVPGADWQLAVCALGEDKHHYRAELRFQLKDKSILKFSHLDGPTGGVPHAGILKASKRFAVLEMRGDESNRIAAFDLQKKTTVLNTGDVGGMSACVVHPETDLEPGSFCKLTLNCPASGPKRLVIGAYLCP